MKKFCLSFLFLLSITSVLFANTNGITSNDTRYIILGNNKGTRPHFCEPSVVYHPSSSTITIDFGNQPIDDYSVIISSPFTDVDYYVTSSFVTIPLAVDGYSDYTIIIETSDGDVFEGTLAAESNGNVTLYPGVDIKLGASFNILQSKY